MKILTQSKYGIIDNYIFIYYDTIPEHCIFAFFSRDCIAFNEDKGILLGKYNSKERCKEIIKNISIAIARGVKCFEMPSE